AAIGADFDEPLDVHRNFLAQVAFNQSFRFNDLADAVHFLFAQVLDLLHGIHVGLVQNARRTRSADAIDVGERDIRPLITGKIDACNTSHICPLLSLTLFMLRVLADHTHHTLAVDDLALIANFLYGCSDLHIQFSVLSFQFSVALFITINNSSAIQVVGRKLDRYFVSGKNADEILAHFSGNVRQHLVLAFQFHPEHGVRQRFNDRCHDFNRVFFAHYLLTKTSLVVGSWSLALGRWLLVVGIRFWPMTNDQKPPTVLLRQNHRAIFGDGYAVFKVRAIAAVYCNCGPLVVEYARAGFARVHHRLNCNDHAFFQLWPIALHAKVGHLQFFVKSRADAMSDKFSYYAEAVGFDVLLHGGTDVSYCVSYPRLLNALVQRGFSHFEQLLQFRRELAIYRDGYRRVSVVTVKHYAAINRSNVARF